MKQVFYIIPFSLMFFLVLIHGNVFSQKDTIKNFECYEISEKQMQIVFKDILTLVDECPFFSKLKKNFYVTLYFLREGELVVQIFPQNVTTISNYRYYYGMKCDGVCFFDNQIFYIQDFSDTKEITKYFMKKDTVVDLYFEKNENYFDHNYPVNVYVETLYIATEEGFIRDDEIEDFEARCGLNNRIGFDYIVQYGDTWKTIATKCFCDEKNLREEYPEFEQPIPGFLIKVKYIFDEKGNFHGVKRPY